MTINLEELACLVIAFLLFVGHVIMIGLFGLVTTEEQGIPKGVLHIAGSVVISSIGMVAVYKLPGSWWFRIIYDSTEENTTASD